MIAFASRGLFLYSPSLLAGLVHLLHVPAQPGRRCLELVLAPQLVLTALGSFRAPLQLTDKLLPIVEQDDGDNLSWITYLNNQVKFPVAVDVLKDELYRRIAGIARERGDRVASRFACISSWKLNHNDVSVEIDGD